MMRQLGVLILTVSLAGAALAQTARTLAVKPVAGPLAGRTLYTNSHALLIGVSKYAHLPADRRLQFADKDALALRDVLVKSYSFPAENVTLLLNEQATKAAIEKALSRFADAQRVGKEDRLLVYFSGHGQTVKLPTEGEMGFLIPHDANVDLKTPDNAGPYLETCVEMEGLWRYLRGCPAKHALVLADACFSGLLVQARNLGDREKLNANELAKQLSRPARQVLTAGGKGEEAFEDASLGHGAFTYKLLEELRAEAMVPGEVFTATDLAAALKRSVSNLTDGKQSPVFGSYRTEGEFLFVAGGGAPAGVVAKNVQPGAGAELAEEAGLLLLQDKYAEAEKLLRQAVRAEPENAAYQFDLGEALRGQRKHAEAETSFRKAVQLEPRNLDHRVRFAQILADQKKEAEGLELLREAVALLPQEAEAHSALAQYLAYPLLKAPEAVAAQREAVRLAPSKAAHRLTLGALLAAQEKPVEAENEYREAVRLDPKNSIAHQALGGYIRGLKRYPEAEKIFKDALSIDPTSTSVLLDLGGLYLKDLKRYVEAETVLRKAVTLDPEFPLIRQYLAEALAGQKRIPEAEKVWQDLLLLEPDDAELRYEHGRFYAGQQKWAQAAAAFREAVKRDGDALVFRVELADALYRAEKYAEAELVCRDLVRLDPTAGTYQDRLGNCLFSQAKYADAEKAYRVATKDPSTGGEPWANLAAAMFQQNRAAEAKTAAQKAISLGCKDHWIYPKLGL